MLLAGASLAALPFSLDGPPPGHTGGFGEPTCRACHSDSGLNEAGGDLSLTGAPARYEPGRTYDLEVNLRRAGMQRAGFQLAARFAAGAAAGTPAGLLSPRDARTKVVWDTVSRVGYIEHTAAGTALVGDAGRWTLRWTAPAATAERRGGGSVSFNLAANAADDDSSPLGDFIYVTAVTVAAARR